MKRRPFDRPAAQPGKTFRAPPAVREPSNFTLLVIDSFLRLFERLAGSCAIGCTVHGSPCYTERPNNWVQELHSGLLCMAIFEIRLPCGGCGKECRATISDGTSSAKFRCASCGQNLLEARSISGYVYVLSHPKLRGMLKVGFTKRTIAQELQELSWVSGLPERFVLEAAFESSSPEKHTAEVHKRLASKRVQGMEYFEATVPFAVKVVQDVIPSGQHDDSGTPASPQADQGEVVSGPLGQWHCGLCKHEWQAAAPDRCPLCQSAVIIRFTAPLPRSGSPTP